MGNYCPFGTLILTLYFPLYRDALGYVQLLPLGVLILTLYSPLYRDVLDYGQFGLSGRRVDELVVVDDSYNKKTSQFFLELF